MGETLASFASTWIVSFSRNALKMVARYGDTSFFISVTILSRNHQKYTLLLLQSCVTANTQWWDIVIIFDNKSSRKIIPQQDCTFFIGEMQVPVDILQRTNFLWNWLPSVNVFKELFFMKCLSCKEVSSTLPWHALKSCYFFQCLLRWMYFSQISYVLAFL